jgi:prohibitin 2
MNPTIIKSATIAGVALLGLIIFFALGPIVIVKTGHRGVVLKFSQVTGETKGEGLHFIVPVFNTVKQLSVQTQKIEDSTLAYSKDIQSVETTIALNYHIHPDNVGNLYQDVQKDFEHVLIHPSIEESVKATTAKFTAQELIEKRPLVKDEIKLALEERLNKYFVVDDFSIVNFAFNEEFEEAVEEKQIAQQTALKAENDLLRIEIEAKQVIESAKAEAESIRIQGNALRNNPGLVDLKAVEKWDGELPVYMLGDAMPFINISN